MRMNVFEMEGFLRGKCVPRDLKVNETNAEYLVRKFAEAEAKISALSEDHQRAIESIKQADAAVKLAHEKFSALAAEHGIQIAINELLALAPRLDKRAVDALSVAVEHLCKLIKKEAVSEQN